MPPQRTERTSRPRVDPVSCQSCRTKKLRCSRQQPCTNCVTRGITCDFRGRLAVDPLPAEEHDLRAENAAIKARLQKLESLVLGNASSLVSRSVPLSTASASPRPLSPSATVSPRSDADRAYNVDSEWLENIATREKALHPHFAHELDVRVVQSDQLLAASLRSKTPFLIMLPTYDHATRIFDDYVRSIDAAQHVIHTPTMRSLIDRLYGQLIDNQKVEPGQVALLLSILASVAFYSIFDEDTAHLFPSQQVGGEAALQWTKYAMDCLEHSRRTTSGSLEAVQTHIILGFQLYHLEGFSPRVRLLQAHGIAVARDLGLHKTDSTEVSPTTKDQAQIMETEMRRRVWWHVASSDWIMGINGGPNEGVYTIQPTHMRVKRPRNINDDDLVTKDAAFERPLSEPTIMSYYLQRLKLAEICRSIIDSTWDPVTVGLNPTGVKYGTIIALDSRFTDMLDELPVFLRFDEESRRTSEAIDRKDPNIALQRYIVNLTVNTRRCKLHLPFLSRASVEPRYTFSRKACLESARRVFEIRRILWTEQSYVTLAHSKLCGVIHHVFYAIVVLVMDLCMNPNAGAEDFRKAEIRETCKILEDVKERSVVAKLFWDSLVAILRKHKVKLQCDAPQIVDAAIAEPDDGQMNSNPVAHGYIEQAQYGVHALETSAFNSNATGELNFDDLWQDFLDPRPNTDQQYWTALFNDLESMG